MKAKMKRLLVVTALLFALVSTAFAQNYPKEIPQNFENAPFKDFCAREEPTSIGLKRFADPQEQWILEILIKNGKEVIIVFERYPYDTGLFSLSALISALPKLYYFTMKSDGWKEYDELTDSEKNSLNSSPIFSSEETKFLLECARDQMRKTN